MNSKYAIVMLCNDDSNYYTDYVNMMYNSEETAAKELKRCLEQEYDSLIQDSDTPEIYSKDDDTVYVNSNVLTRYSIIQITKQEEEKEEEKKDSPVDPLTNSLYRMYNFSFPSVSKILLDKALSFFRYIFEIKSDEAETYSCGSLVKLSRIIGKDYRNSNLLFKIAEEFEKVFEPEFTPFLPSWRTAIMNVVGEENFTDAFDEELPDIEDIAQVFREYENQEFLNLSNCEVEYITNNEAMLGHMFSAVFNFLKDEGITWDEIDMSHNSTDGYRFKVLNILIDVYKKFL